MTCKGGRCADLPTSYPHPALVASIMMIHALFTLV